jgi:hypothetical protein
MFRLSLLSILLGTTLAACGGGGGGGDSGPPVPPPSTALALDSTNYVAASTEAMSSALFLLDAPSLAVGVEHSDANEAIRFGLAQVPLLGSRFNGVPVAVGVVQSETWNCALGGTVTAAATDADNNGAPSAGDSLSMTATNCSDETNSVVNGRLMFRFETLSGDLNTDFYDASITMTFDNLSVSTAGSAVSAHGDLALTMKANGAYSQVQTISATSLTATATYGSTTYSRSLSNFSATLTTAPNLPASTFKTTSNVSGSLTSSALDNKSVAISTAVPFARLSTQAYPSSGQGFLAGSTAAKVRLTVQDATNVLLELDSNGDGVYETSSTKKWIELR